MEAAELFRETSMRVPGYVEPVALRFNAYEMTPWVDWVARIMMMRMIPGGHRIRPSFAFVSSALLCETVPRRVGGLNCQLFDLVQRLLVGDV